MKTVTHLELSYLTYFDETRGGLSNCMGTYMADKYPDMKVTVVSFAGPRVGNQAYKDWSEAKSNLASWRYVYNRDAVPRLGPLTAGYVDSGHTLQITPSRPGFDGWKPVMKPAYTSIYYRHTGNGGSYAGVPLTWYIPTGKYKLAPTSLFYFILVLLFIKNCCLTHHSFTPSHIILTSLSILCSIRSFGNYIFSSRQL